VELEFLVRFQAGVPKKMNKENKLIPGLPSGFEDRWNKELILKKKLINLIENNFIKFGFEPLETPSFEISENIGSFLANDDSNPMSDVFSLKDGERNITLRYDLSSPLARFVAQNNQELPSPYKRYAIQNVFRNEKAGNARYREFTQADCDIVGNVNPAQANAELCNLIASTLLVCGLTKDQFIVNISNRKIVQGLIEDLKISEEKKIKVMRAIDKLDKPGFGLRGVEDLLKKERVDVSGAVTKGADLTDDQASQIITFLKVKDLKELKKNLKNPLSQEGIKELEDLLKIISYGDYLEQIKTNFTIVRGLAYYDGFCVETNLNFKATNKKGKEVDIGSICSGGQYNKLISRFRGVDIPGTGMSIGVDRLLFTMLQLNQINIDEKKPVIVCVMDDKYLKNYYEILKVLRNNDINSEIFLDSKKNLGKQLTYANKKQCPIAIICGENEFKNNTITLKNLLGVKGENNQVTFSKENLIDEVKKFI
jgi:histidyl-tRNA synthetase